MEEKKPISPQLKAMQIGDIACYPLQRTSVVKVACSMISLETGVKFRTKINRDENNIKVIRIK